MSPRTVVMAQGYVGLPLAVSLAEAGHLVVGYDTDEALVRLLADGCVPGAPEGLRSVLASAGGPALDACGVLARSGWPQVIRV